MPILSVPSEYLQWIREGRKTSTIRLAPPRGLAINGPLTFTDYRESVRVRVQTVRMIRLDALTDADARHDGFASVAELRRVLDRHYALAPDVVLCLIRFAVNDSPQSVRASDASGHGAPT